MPERDHDTDPGAARRKLIELLEDIDGWRFTDSAFAQGRVALKAAFGKTPSDCEMIDYIVCACGLAFPSSALLWAIRLGQEASVG